MGHLGTLGRPVRGEELVQSGTSGMAGTSRCGVGTELQEEGKEGTSYPPQTPASQSLAAACPQSFQERDVLAQTGLAVYAKNRAPELPAWLLCLPQG